MRHDGGVRDDREAEWDWSVSLWLEPATDEDALREAEWIQADNARMRKVMLASERRYLALAWTARAGGPVAAGGGAASDDGDLGVRLRLQP
jgi:hypothetical protein